MQDILLHLLSQEQCLCLLSYSFLDARWLLRKAPRRLRNRSAQWLVTVPRQAAIRDLISGENRCKQLQARSSPSANLMPCLRYVSSVGLPAPPPHILPQSLSHRPSLHQTDFIDAAARIHLHHFIKQLENCCMQPHPGRAELQMLRCLHNPRETHIDRLLDETGHWKLSIRKADLRRQENVKMSSPSVEYTLPPTMVSLCIPSPHKISSIAGIHVAESCRCPNRCITKSKSPDAVSRKQWPHWRGFGGRRCPQRQFSTPCHEPEPVRLCRNLVKDTDISTLHVISRANDRILHQLHAENANREV